MDRAGCGELRTGETHRLAVGKFGWQSDPGLPPRLRIGDRNGPAPGIIKRQILESAPENGHLEFVAPAVPAVKRAQPL